VAVRRSFTAVLEQGSTFTADFATEPYETAWAGEARWFVRVLELTGRDAGLRLHPEISPDGLFWCDEGTAPLELGEAGLYSLALRHFGHWLRLRGVLVGTDARAKVLIYLALKE
jgi:hypothetical protein